MIKKEKKNVWLAEEKKDKEGKRSTREEKDGNFLEKENIWPVEEKKNERERDKIIWRRKRKKYLEMEIIWSAEEQKNEEGRGKYLGEGKSSRIGRRVERHREHCKRSSWTWKHRIKRLREAA